MNTYSATEQDNCLIDAGTCHYGKADKNTEKQLNCRSFNCSRFYHKILPIFNWKLVNYEVSKKIKLKNIIICYVSQNL